jgi:glycosyltransferase involved in cell wall biosynthesis
MTYTSAARVRVVVPAYEEAESLGPVLDGLRRTVAHELFVVDDGSTDGTGRIARTAGVRCLSLPCNLGYGGAVQAGLEVALAEGCDVVVLFDADGQHLAADVDRVLAPVLAGVADVAIGSRYSDGRPYGGPLGRRLGQRVFSGLTRLAIGRRIYDTTSGFKAMNAAACRAIVDTTFLDLHMETIVQLSLLGFRITEVPVTMSPRHAGSSMHGLASAWKYPAKTLLLGVVALLDAFIIRSRSRRARPGGRDEGSPA